MYHYFVNAGIYVLEPDVLERIPKQKYLDMPILLGTLMKDKQSVGTFPLREYWIDIGQMDQFEQAVNEFDEHFS